MEFLQQNLPDIKGQTTITQWNGNTNRNNSASGAFYIDGYHGSFGYQGGGSPAMYWKTYFKASRHNSTYSDTNVVRPNSLSCYYLLQAY